MFLSVEHDEASMGSSDEVIRLYNQGYDCAQCIVKAMIDKVGCDEETAMKAVSGMSMGLLEGSVCGGILGALAVIGLRYGNVVPDASISGIMIIKRAQFLMEFKKRYKGLTCPEIMGLDVRKDEDNLKAHKEKIYEHFCPNVGGDIIDILNGIIE